MTVPKTKPCASLGHEIAALAQLCERFALELREVQLSDLDLPARAEAQELKATRDAFARISRLFGGFRAGALSVKSGLVN